MDKLNVMAWEGRTQSSVGGIMPAEAARIHATLGAAHEEPPGMGDELPPLWHWCAFLPTKHNSELARDGHPRLGDFLPPVRLERRMWAGGRLTFGAPMRVGEVLKKHSTITAVQEKTTGSGPMVLVSVAHRIYTERGLAIEESQNIVYLDIPEEFTPPKKRPLPESPFLHEQKTVTEALLFRYSAITFNAHRIHFDLPYAQEVEHYPGLVIHGPLQATYLMQAACREEGRRPKEFEFRGVHPCLLVPGKSPEVDIMANREDCGALSLFTGQNGHQCMQATAQWEGTQ
jgi:3-methylfumaryl-CoA hydratase